MTPKGCRRCGQVKDISEFGRRSDAADGLNRVCKRCNVEVATLARERHPETSREWEKANLETRRKQKRASFLRRREAGLAYPHRTGVVCACGWTGRRLLASLSRPCPGCGSEQVRPRHQEAS